MFELNKIYQMDCLEYMDELIKQGVKVDAIITSPPYYNAGEYSFYETYEDYLLFIKKVFVKSHSLLKSDSFLIINVSPVIDQLLIELFHLILYKIPPYLLLFFHLNKYHV